MFAIGNSETTAIFLFLRIAGDRKVLAESTDENIQANTHEEK